MTTSERLAQLERFQQDSNHQFTILMGIVSEQEKDLKRMLTVLDEHTVILTQHSHVLQQHSQMLQQILDRLPAPGKE
jgi:hypothetical protein